MAFLSGLIGPILGLLTQGGANHANQNAADHASGQAAQQGAAQSGQQRDYVLQWLQNFLSQTNNKQGGFPGAAGPVSGMTNFQRPDTANQTGNIANMLTQYFRPNSGTAPGMTGPGRTPPQTPNVPHPTPTPLG